ncbi:translocation/assembly module TamB domain-containing protein [Mameliella sediminis]|uniref:translocation/assembly module TamB domain-containing protein n=1 Tax=Mameliella sediminis TaxID=2836866 RepID=UPI001C476E86|nr:translocation/assembly module TamB domain-containing protein [Mameliella sediminis]MBV7393980.1 translocation/assembly module TamB domain-containing protein [Mameliella sediminis]
MRFFRFFVVLVLWPLAALAQDDDRGYIQGLLEDALSDAGREVRIEGFAGALSSRATIQRITIADEDGVWLTASDIAMTWTRTALVRGAVEIDEISVGRIEMPRLPVPLASDTPPAPEARSPFKLPELPVSLRLADLDLREVALGAPVATEDLVLRVTGNAQLSGGEGNAELRVQRLDAGGDLKLAGSYSNTSRVLVLDSSFEEPAGGLIVRKLGLPGEPSVALTLTGNAPVDDFAADLRLSSDGRERLAGQVVLRADGDTETQRVSLDIGGDLAPLLAPAYREFLGDDIALKAEATRAADGALTLQDLRLSAEALLLTGSAAIGGDGWPQRLALEGQITPPEGNEVLLPLPGQKIYVSGATLEGKFDAAEGNGWALSLQGQGIATEAGRADRLILSGVGEIDRDRTRVTGDLMLAAGGLALADPALAEAVGTALRGALSVDWQPGAPLSLSGLDLSGSDYGLTGAVTVTGAEDLNPRITPDIRLAAEDLSRFAALSGVALRGAADLSVSGAVLPVTGGFDLVLDGTTRGLATGIAQLDPLIAGAGSLQLEAVRDENGLRAEKLLLVTPEARIEGGGTLATGASSLRAEARIRETALVLPDLSGPTALTLRADQAGDLWTLNADGTLAEAGRLIYAGTVDLGPDVPVAAGRLEATLGRLSAFSGVAGRRLGGSAELVLNGEAGIDGADFSLSAEGRVTDLRLDMAEIDPLLVGRTALSVTASRSGNGPIRFDPLLLDGVLDARFTGTVDPGGVNGPQVDGRLTADMASLTPLSRLSGQALRGAAQIEAEARGGVLQGPLSLTAVLRGQGLGIGQASVDPLIAGSTRLDLNVTRLDDGAYRIGEAKLDSSGIDARITGSYGPAEAADLNLVVALANIGSLVPEVAGPAQVTGTARRDGGPWQLSLDGSGPAGIGARVRGSAAADFSRFDLALNGSAPLSLANRRLAPQVINGVVTFDLGLSGPPALSSLSGVVSTNGARFAAPAQNIVLGGLGGQIRLSGGRADVSMSGQLDSGGSVALDGPVTLSAPYNGNLVLRLRNTVVRQPDLFETTANGEIRIDGPLAGGARIGGTVDLGTVEARIPNIGASYSALDGLRHQGMPQDVALTLAYAGMDKAADAGGGTASPYPLDLTVRATNRIFVRGRGLDAELGGSLRLRGSTSDIVPVGQFDLIRGRLDLLGRRLDLTEGAVFLRGSFDPVVRFVATTRVEDTDITITIEGPASSPELTVGSVPDLPQDEALSFFLFGKSVTNLSALQAVQLASAIRTLSGKGGLGLTESLRSGLGVSELDIGTADDGTAQARVGAYIGKNIYSDVSVDAKGKTEINLNLNVTSDVTVRGRLGSDGSSGIGVFFERDY